MPKSALLTGALTLALCSACGNTESPLASTGDNTESPCGESTAIVEGVFHIGSAAELSGLPPASGECFTLEGTLRIDSVEKLENLAPLSRLTEVTGDL